MKPWFWACTYNNVQLSIYSFWSKTSLWIYCMQCFCFSMYLGKFWKTVHKKSSLKTFPHSFLRLKEEVNEAQPVEIFALTKMKWQDQIVPIFLFYWFYVVQIQSIHLILIQIDTCILWRNRSSRNKNSYTYFIQRRRMIGNKGQILSFGI